MSAVILIYMVLASFPGWFKKLNRPGNEANIEQVLLPCGIIGMLINCLNLNVISKNHPLKTVSHSIRKIYSAVYSTGNG